MPAKEVKLKVAEAIQDDVNKGIVRIDSGIMHQLDINVGDIVEIEGQRKTVGIADRAYPGDIGLNIIRMDGIIRKNGKTTIGDFVMVRKADIKEAKRVLIAPARKGIMVKASPDFFKQGLLGRAVVKGDVVALGGSRRRRTTFLDSPFEDMFKDLFEDSFQYGFGDIKFVVADTNPKQPVIITQNTQIEFNAEAVEVQEERLPEVTYEDIGGLSDEVKKVREMVELPLKHPEIFERLGIEAPKGVLLHGPPGTGKTLLAKAVANETNSHFLVINGPEIMSKYYGQSEENLRKRFEEAEKNAPAIIFIDEIDAIASKREETRGEVERRVVAQLLALMDGLKARGKVVVIAATNVPNILDPALRRPGRFDREIEIGVPDAAGRQDILKIHTRGMPIYNKEHAIRELKNADNNYKEILINLLRTDESRDKITKKSLNEMIQNYLKNHPEKNDIFKDIDVEQLYKILSEAAVNPNIVYLKEISTITHGFVGADLNSLAKEAAMIVLRRVLPDLKLGEDSPIPKEVLEQLRITQKDFKEALKVVRPSALREVLVEIPNIRWKDIGGLEIVKQELKEAIEWPLKYPEAFIKLGVRPPRGILLYGAPGTGKTLLAKAVAKESEANFISIKGPELLSKWVGESEKAVREVFKKARQTSPTIVFFDEIESITPTRSAAGDGRQAVAESMVNQLLTEMDGLEELQDVVVVAATNRPDIIDTALLRPGRFDRIILTPNPDEKTREEIFKIHTKNMPLKNVDLKELASKTDGYVGADIESVCREAATLALRKSNLKAKHVTKEDFDDALEKVSPSVTKDIQEAYQDLKSKFSSARAKQMKDEKPSYYG